MLSQKTLTKYILVSCAIYAASLILDISLFNDDIGGHGSRSQLRSYGRRGLSNLPSFEDASFMNSMIFSKDPSPETAELQKNVRIHHFECDRELDADYDLGSHTFLTSLDHPDSQVGVISCKPVHYRIPDESTRNIQHSIVFGVLSSSKEMRDSIRKTWGKNRAVFFLVAGEWEGDIEEEYNRNRDLIWVDQPELYRKDPTEPVTEGALTFKTEAFLLASHNQIMRNSPNVNYFFKTDDDCYVDVNGLSKSLSGKSEHGTVDYWGKCVTKNVPFRNEKTRYYVSWKDYPFSYFPDYCIGSGYVMSAKLLECAVGEGHIERVHYLTNEDGAVGLLAERCGVVPASLSLTGGQTDIPTELHFDKDRLRGDYMKDIIVQHNIKTEEDMVAVHKRVIELKRSGVAGDDNLSVPPPQLGM